ncbi:MAG: PAS domain S-box protein [Nitrospirae bacterium]|nr:MAG: PAS domain S-box protein [Nitrospirota bacterium]
MRYSLQKRVTVFIALVLIILSSVSTGIFIYFHRKSVEKEIIARGLTMAESLSKAIDTGLAAEDLDFIKEVEDIVHTRDVDLAQVYTSLWHAVDAYPADRQNEPPDPAAVEFYKTERAGGDHYYRQQGSWFDFYAPVYYAPSARTSKDTGLLIGYVRLKLSTVEVRQGMIRIIVINSLVSLIIVLLAIAALHTFIGRNVLNPLMRLYSSVSRHQVGKFPETVPVTSDDEIGRLSAEFNAMSLALREREDRLAEEKERLAVTLRSIGDAVIVTDIKGEVTLLNKVAEEHTGWTMQEAVGRQLTEVFHIINEKTRERSENPVDKVVRSGIIIGLANHTALIRRDGSEIVIEDSAAPIRDRASKIMGVVLVFRDVTAKHKMEEELLKVEKLQSVGLLAGGLAHDFNNLLTSIMGNISLAKRYIAENSKAYERLSEAETASQRATDLTRQLLTFSKGGAPVKKTVSIEEIIRESASLTLCGTNVAPEFNIADDVRPVDVDSGQMSQVFNNLIINAVHAMPDGGTIVFTVGNALIGGQEVPTLDEGAYVVIRVKDSGTGIPDDYLKRIFDPYFTTKQKGSGLGLTSVYSIISRHDGHIAVEANAGKGVTFTIHLPASFSTAAVQSLEERGINTGHERILIMDDDNMVRDIAGEMLHSMGYQCAFARDGEEAIARYRQAMEEKEPFDAVIMDLTIPGGMGGGEAIKLLLALDPHARVIVSSGYSNDPVMSDYAAHGFSSVITKPYSLVNLSRTIREALKA